MGLPAAKKGDQIVSLDTHTVVLPNGATTPAPHPFSGLLVDKLSSNVFINKRPAARVDSIARITVAHFPTSPGTAFQKPPENEAKVTQGSQKVFINGKSAARHGDPAETCNDAPAQPAKIIAVCNVMIG